MKIAWSGPAPSPRLLSALRARGISVGANAVAQVVATRGDAAPVTPQLPWIWVPPRPVPVERIHEAVLHGAHDVVPISEPDQLATRLLELAAPEAAPPDASAFVGRSPATQLVLAHAARAARTSMPVLVTGETGTGKEVVARLIHGWSERAARPFVPINCAAIPNELIEAELFGYTRGAFSGAVRDYEGQLAGGEGGSVFLDEIDDTPHPLQVKLLRVLEDRVVSRLGENVGRRVNFRILAATNRDLVQLVEQGAFGADLYERLAIVHVHLPPLRERIEDLPLLCTHLLSRYLVEEPAARVRVKDIGPAALAALAAYPWPGNVRELRNVLFEALVFKRAGEELLVSDLPRRILSTDAGGGELVDQGAVTRAIASGKMNLRREVEALERAALNAALARTGGKAAAAARLLGEVGRGSARDPGGTVRAMMRRLKVSGGRGRPGRSGSTKPGGR